MGMRSVLLAGAASLCFAVASQAAVSYSTAGSTYTQNFDSLPNAPAATSLGNTPTGWTDDNASPAAGNFSIVGWYLWHDTAQTEGGFNSHQRMRIGTGSNNTGSFWSYGASASTERALGDVGSNTIAAQETASANNGIFIGVAIQNDTGGAIDNITVSYTGEQWRDGGDPAPHSQTMFFNYAVNPTGITDSAAFAPNAVSALDFTSPTFANTGGGGALDGNNLLNRTAKGPTLLTGLTLQSGETLWLRWFDPNNIGNDHGLAIDDFSFTAQEAIPEPASLAMLGLLGLALSRRR
jgi:hypothetical protein